MGIAEGRKASILELVREGTISVQAAAEKLEVGE